MILVRWSSILIESPGKTSTGILSLILGCIFLLVLTRVAEHVSGCVTVSAGGLFGGFSIAQVDLPPCSFQSTWIFSVKSDFLCLFMRAWYLSASPLSLCSRVKSHSWVISLISHGQWPMCFRIQFLKGMWYPRARRIAIHSCTS